MTKSFKEEFILRNLWISDNELENDNNTVKKIDLRDEAIKLFMRNNFENYSGKIT
jgi:hypothetical protein